MCVSLQAEQAAAELSEQTGVSVIGVQCDVSDEQKVSQFHCGGAAAISCYIIITLVMQHCRLLWYCVAIGGCSVY